MFEGKKFVPHTVLALLTLCATLFLFPQLPAQIPLQWGLSGQVNRYGDRYSALTVPGIMFLSCIFAWQLPRLDPRSENYRRFGDAYVQLMLLVQVFLALMQAAILAETLHPGSVQMQTLVPLGIGLLFTLLGNLMPKLKHNYFAGVRTPWTLSDEENWYATHRLAGRVWFAGGLIMTCGALLPVNWGMPILFTSAIVISVIPAVYSCIFYLRKKKRA